MSSRKPDPESVPSAAGSGEARGASAEEQNAAALGGRAGRSADCGRAAESARVEAQIAAALGGHPARAAEGGPGRDCPAAIRSGEADELIAAALRGDADCDRSAAVSGKPESHVAASLRGDAARDRSAAVGGKPESHEAASLRGDAARDRSAAVGGKPESHVAASLRGDAARDRSAAVGGHADGHIASALRGDAGRERSAAVGGDDAWLAELLSRPGGPPDPAKLSALQAELARPERRRARWPALLIWPLSGLAVVAGRAWIGDRTLFRVDLANAAPRLSWGIAVLAVCAALAVGAVLYRGRAGFGLRSAFVRAVAVGLSVLIALTPLWMRGAFPQPVLHAFGAPCAAVVMIAGALALGVTWWLFRRSQPVGAASRALALGAATAAWTGIVISLHCPGETLPHLAWGHSLPLLVLVGLAAWLLPRRLQP